MYVLDLIYTKMKSIGTNLRLTIHFLILFFFPHFYDFANGVITLKQYTYAVIIALEVTTMKKRIINESLELTLKLIVGDTLIAYIYAYIYVCVFVSMY